MAVSYAAIALLVQGRGSVLVMAPFAAAMSLLSIRIWHAPQPSRLGEDQKAAQPSPPCLSRPPDAAGSCVAMTVPASRVMPDDPFAAMLTRTGGAVGADMENRSAPSANGDGRRRQLKAASSSGARSTP